MLVGDIETMMSELIFLGEIPFEEIFKILQLGTDISADMIRVNRTLGICLLTISFFLALCISVRMYTSSTVISKALKMCLKSNITNLVLT